MARQWASGDLSELREASAAWVEQVCGALATDPPKRLKTVITKLTDTGHESAQVPELDLVGVAFAARGLGDRAPAFDGVWSIAAAHREVFDQVPVLDEQRSPQSLREQRTWVSASAGEPILRAYVERAGELRFDRAVFDEVFDQAERDLRSATSPYAVYAPIAQVRVSGSAAIEVLHGVFIRPATTADRERWLNRPQTGPIEQMGMLDVEAVLETTYDESKDPFGSALGARNAQELIDRVDTALQLALDCDAHHSYVEFHREAIFGTPWGGMVSPPPRRGRASGELKGADVNVIRELVAALASSVNLSHCAIALRRWDDVCARGRDEDRIVDSWVGLESLLFTGKETEIAYRASMRLAALIGTDGAERRQLLNDVRKLSYDARSRVLHGDETTRLDMPRRAREARAYLRRALIAILGMPVPFDPNRIDADLVASGWMPNRPA